MRVIAKQESKHIKYSRGSKYQLRRDAWFETHVKGYKIDTEYIHLYHDGWLLISDGYAWDGASGPTIDTKSSMRGSLVHDALYQLIRLELLPRECRVFADKELQEKCLADKMWSWRAKIWYKILRRYAGPAAHPDHKRKEYTAP